MKILVLEGLASQNAGGAERTMRHFLDSVRHEHEIHLAYATAGDLVTDPEKASLYSSMTQHNLQPVSLKSGFSQIADLVRLYRLVRQHNIERVVTHMVHVSPLLRILKALTGVPFSIYFKWVCSSETAGAKSAWGNAAVDRGAAVSGFVRDYWERSGIPAGTVQVVPEGVEMPDKVICGSRRCLTIGFAGRLVPEKGLIILLKAMPKVLCEMPETVLRVAGAFQSDSAGVAYKAEVDACIKKLGIESSVCFDGFVNPIEDWLQECDVIAVPSTCGDAQPIVMMQSMASGVPVVATRVGGIPEVLTGEFQKLLVAPEDPHELAKRLLNLLADPKKRKKVGDALRARCETSYAYPLHVAALSHALGLTNSTSQIPTS
jgi:glycosyltransferase involved in cell wall biosynthesis